MPARCTPKKAATGCISDTLHRACVCNVHWQMGHCCLGMRARSHLGTVGVWTGVRHAECARTVRDIEILIREAPSIDAPARSVTPACLVLDI